VVKWGRESFLEDTLDAAIPLSSSVLKK